MSPFRYLLRVRYPECDPQGIAFNANYGLWTDLATTELARAMDPRLLDAHAPGEGPGLEQGFDYRLRAQATEWLAPARFDDVLSAAVTVEHIGTSSLRLCAAFSRWPTADAVAVVRTTYVMVDGDGRKRTIDAPLRRLLEQAAAGRITDHSGAGGGTVVAVVTPADRRTMPWKNGGGVTHELWKEGEGAAGFSLRLSMADVAADGPFSRFPGVDRTILLFDGPGFTLTRADGMRVGFQRPYVPFAFAGEDAWDCTLASGPVLDFNVMADRATLRTATRLASPGTLNGRFALALEPGRIGGQPVERGTLVEVDGPVASSVRSLEITVCPA